jgi:cytochrome oxidase Cu insertion factor (SCO1/SenC/PrrC family)
MDWKRILRIAAIASVVVLLFSICSACIRDKSKIVDWDDCSQEMGDHPCDFTLVDQHGEDFNLYDHYGKIIIIDSFKGSAPGRMESKIIDILNSESEEL